MYFDWTPTSLLFKTLLSLTEPQHSHILNNSPHWQSHSVIRVRATPWSPVPASVVSSCNVAKEGEGKQMNKTYTCLSICLLTHISICIFISIATTGQLSSKKVNHSHFPATFSWSHKLSVLSELWICKRFLYNVTPRAFIFYLSLLYPPIFPPILSLIPCVSLPPAENGLAKTHHNKANLLGWDWHTTS